MIPNGAAAKRHYHTSDECGVLNDVDVVEGEGVDVKDVLLAKLSEKTLR